VKAELEREGQSECGQQLGLKVMRGHLRVRGLSGDRCRGLLVAVSSDFFRSDAGQYQIIAC
jgi:hypothetical protein